MIFLGGMRRGWKRWVALPVSRSGKNSLRVESCAGWLLVLAGSN